MAKSSRHHLIWTRRDWVHSALRRGPQAKIKLPGDVHRQFHLENEPFRRLSKSMCQRFEWLVRRMEVEWIECPRDVLMMMVYLSIRLTYEAEDQEDLRALLHNARVAYDQICWLDAHVPNWGGQPNSYIGSGLLSMTERAVPIGAEWSRV